MYRTFGAMPASYREDRATQAAARLIELHGGSINVMKLIKLLYYLDRTAIIRWGRPITFDYYFSLPRGPILSITLDNVNAEQDPEMPSYWSAYISERDGNNVHLRRSAPIPADQLSPAEEGLIGEIYERFRDMDQFEISRESHLLPEYLHPGKSNRPIAIEDILRAEGFSEDEVADVLEGLEAEAIAERILG
jgi:hypothetical protein